MAGSEAFMLFNSFAFLFVFLPLAVGLHWLAERFRPRWRLFLLVGLSCIFYGYWDVRFIPLLLGSIGLNWLAAEAFFRFRRKSILWCAMAADLLSLGLFKYFDFFSGLLFGPASPGLGLALPLGISFFTFHHVMYLADLNAGRAPRFSLVRYAIYIAFFPQVLAGPLVRWREMMHQLDERPYARPDAAERFARGLLLITVGLAKKVLLGDRLAALVNPTFQKVAQGQAASVHEAWQAVLGFTFQIYFDFSGYTDIALGLALLFGIALPQNFDVPYRAASLQDFWRRWHMTLSRVLRDYLYVPLGGSRSGLAVQFGALFATMTLGGLWHGANLTFVAWGAAHGAGLGAGVLWRKAGRFVPKPLGMLLTFFFVAALWVLFRSPSFGAAGSLYKSLIGLAPAGSGFKWASLLPAAVVATVGPTAWDFVHRLPPWRWAAVAFAVLLVLVLFKIGDNENYEFIYFRF